MTEILVVCASAAVVLAAVLLRLNNLYVRHDGAGGALEAVGLALLASGCAGVIGEQLLPHGGFEHAKSLFVFGSACAVLGASRGHLHDAVARLRGWGGEERRRESRPVECDMRGRG